MKLKSLLILLLMSVVLSTRASDEGLASILAPDTEPRKLADGFGFGEGPAWHLEEQALYFSDLKNKTMHRWSEADGISKVRQGEVTFTNGIVVDSEGRLVYCETGALRVLRREKDGTETVLLDEVDGKPLGITNDLWIAPDDGLYVTIPNKKTREVADDAVFGTIVYLSPEGKASDVGAAIGIKAPNGIVGSHDGKKLYFRDGGKIRVADIGEDGSLSSATEAASSGTDGLTLDEKGNLYLTTKGGVEVFAPGGKSLGIIELGENGANMTFGGPEGKTLFVTAQTGLYAVDMLVKGDAFRED